MSKILSVIIPVYSDDEGLMSTLNSLKKNSLDESKYEILIEHDENQKGSYYARNRAIEKSKGNYLAFIDAGTIASENWLSEGLNSLKKYDYVGGVVNLFEKEEKRVPKFLLSYEKEKEFPVKEFFELYHFFPTTNLFVNREVFDKLGYFDERLKSSGDLEFGDRVFESKKFSQSFNRNLKVFHPARNLKEMISKQVRLAKGFVDLKKYHPKRFKGVSGNFVINLTKALIGFILYVSFRAR